MSMINLSNFLKNNYNYPVSNLTCPHCDDLHNDIDDRALIPHLYHICDNCNESFESDRYCVSNPAINTLNTGATFEDVVMYLQDLNEKASSWDGYLSPDELMNRFTVSNFLKGMFSIGVQMI